MTGRPHGNTTHGGAKRSGRAPEYNGWFKMLTRCRDPRSPDYPNYGGRGITVDERWADFGVFLADMGSRPSSSHTLERTDNNAGYSPSNCVWATRAEQNRNRRPRRLRELCQRGHALAGDNLYQRPDGKRGCRACRSLNMRAFYERHGAAS